MPWTCAPSPLEQSPPLLEKKSGAYESSLESVQRHVHIYSYADSLVVSLQDHIDFCFVIYVWITLDYHKKYHEKYLFDIKIYI